MVRVRPTCSLLRAARAGTASGCAELFTHECLLRVASGKPLFLHLDVSTMNFSFAAPPEWAPSFSFISYESLK